LTELADAFDNLPVLDSIPVRGASGSPLLLRSFRKAFPSAVRAEGASIWDARGKQYLDLSGSAAVNFIGHRVPAIPAAMMQQAKQVEFVHTSQFTTPVAEEFAHELLEFAGESFRGGAVYFTCGGSEAVETALKLARQYQVESGRPKRFQVLSRTQSYHGSTLGALSVSGNKRRREIYVPMVREFAHIGIPYCYRCVFECADGCRVAVINMRRNWKLRLNPQAEKRLLLSLSQSAVRHWARLSRLRDIFRASQIYVNETTSC
jgi:adenosylmethionine-8-amino-7-oxononanoate aminotransferase